MVRIAFIGKNDERLNVLKTTDYEIVEIIWGDGYKYDQVIDLFIIQHTEYCQYICEFIHSEKLLKHVPIICLVDNIQGIENILSDLVISNQQSDIEFMCQVRTLVKMKLTDDELKKEKIVLELKVKDRTNELKNKADRLNVTLNSIGDGVIVTDSDGFITVMNPVAVELTELNDYIGKHIDDVIDIDLNGHRLKIFEMVKESKKTCYIDDDSVLISSSGNRIHISDSASPIFDKNNEMDGIVVVFKDNTLEYQMKSELIKKEERYRQIYDNVPDIIYTMDFNGVFTSINTTLDFGYNVDEILGRNIDEFMDKRNIDIKNSHIIKKMSSPHDITQYEIEIIQKDGSVNPLEIKSYFTFDDNDKPKEVFGIARSIRDRRKYLNMLKIHSERYGSLFKNMGKMVCVLKSYNKGDDFFFSEWNDMFLKVENKTTEMIDGIELYQAIPEYKTFDFKQYLNAVWCTGTPRIIDNIELVNSDKKGWRRFSIYRLESTDEIAFIGEDITEYKEFNEKLQREKERAEESDKLKTTFLTNMSHEIRTPLNLIMGYSQLLSKENMVKDERNKYLQIIDTNGKLLLDIIDSIIDLSKIQSNTIKLNVENFDVNKLLSDSLDEYIKIASDRGKSHLNINMSNNREILRLNTDKYKIKQILNNLVVNAIKFTNTGFINYGYYMKNGQVVFYVKDSGRSISDDEKKIIFERFVKIQPKSDKTIEGMGIGLTITKSLVEMLGGKIWVESNGIKGSEFYFSIPYNHNNYENNNRISNTKYNWHDKRIAVISDKMYNFYNMIFKIHGAVVLEYSDNIYDVLIIDIDDHTEYTELIKSEKCIVINKNIKINDVKEMVDLVLCKKC